MNHGIKKKPRVGLVLGGGGLKTFAALPFFDFLRKNEISLDAIVGTSGGALMGSLYTLGLSLHEIEKITMIASGSSFFTKLNYKTLLGLMRIPFCKIDEKHGILDPTEFQKNLQDIFGDKRIEDLHPKLIIKATDIYTGKSVSIRKGLLWPAIYASSCIYPFLPPVKIEDRYLVDGAFSMPFGLIDIVDEKLDLVIILSFTFLPDKEPTSFLEYFNNLYCLSLESKGRQALSLPMMLYHGDVIVIKMCLEKPATIFQSNKIPSIIEEGRKAVEGKANEILTTYKHLLNRMTSSE